MTIEGAQRMIRNAWLAALILAVLTLVGPWVPLSTAGEPRALTTVLVEAVLVAGLGYGVLRRNTMCAAGLVTYFITSRLSAWIGQERASGVEAAIIFTWFFMEGVRGTVVHGRLTREQDRLATEVPKEPQPTVVPAPARARGGRPGPATPERPSIFGPRGR